MILGYADRLSVAPGERIQFMVSCDDGPYEAAFVRLTGANRRSAAIDTPASGRYAGRFQPIRPGSYAQVQDDPCLNNISELTIQLWCMPTRAARGRSQTLVSRWTADSGGISLGLEPDGRLAFRAGDLRSTDGLLVSDAPLMDSQWYFVAATYSAHTRQATLQHVQTSSWDPAKHRGMVSTKVPEVLTGGAGAPLLFGAAVEPGGRLTSVQATDFFNGKLEAPRLFRGVLSSDQLDALQRDLEPGSVALDTLVGAWDFSHDISSVRFNDVSGHELHGQLINMPARGMTGHAWTGRVLDFPLAPRDWGAIHFHEDDLDDAGWEPDFSWKIPNDLRSGVYAAVLTGSTGEECIPFFVRSRSGEATANIAFLAPTMTYVAYANYRQSAEAGEQMGGSDIYGLVTDRQIEISETDRFLSEHPELGLCIYETHADRSTNFYSSRLRPIVNMRPGYHYWMTGAPRHFAADLLLVEWLEDRGFAYDVITDEDLHAEGNQLLSEYRVVVTGSHPEYWTEAMLDGLESYLSDGGRLMYLGGNGLWWVTSVHPERPHIIEVRKGVMFMPPSTGLAGETCHSTTGERGGAWRDRGRAPQRLLGVGLTAMGWGPAPGYDRLPDSFDPRVAFIFEGVEADETIGDFGLILGGAAGDEIDRFDRGLGSPPETLLLATTSGKHSDHYQLLPWDVQTFLLGHGGTQDARVRADMTYFETRNGGAVFSVGSINWIGSLAFNGGNNNVSRVTENTLRRFMT